jgi:hypothetical protein
MKLRISSKPNLILAAALLAAAAAGTSRGATTFHDFSTDPDFAGQWTNYQSFGTIAVTPAWSSTNQNLELVKAENGNGLAYLYPNGSSRAPGDPVSLTIDITSVATGGTAGSFAQAGLIITSVPQQTYLAGTGDSYMFLLRTTGAVMSTSTFRFEVWKTVADGPGGTWQLYSAPAVAAAGPHTLDIKRAGDNYEFWADNTLLYTSGDNVARDTYNLASKDSMIHYQTIFGGDRAMTGTIDNFGVVPEPSSALLGGLGCLVLLRRRR